MNAEADQSETGLRQYVGNKVFQAAPNGPDLDGEPTAEYYGDLIQYEQDGYQNDRAEVSVTDIPVSEIGDAAIALFRQSHGFTSHSGAKAMPDKGDMPLNGIVVLLLEAFPAGFRMREYPFKIRMRPPQQLNGLGIPFKQFDGKPPNRILDAGTGSSASMPSSSEMVSSSGP